MAKKEDIKNGNDITLDDGNITVLQETEFSKEKEAEKAKVAVDVPVPEEITPDVKVGINTETQPTIDVTKSEEPQNKVSDVPKIDLGGIDLDALSSSLETPVPGAHSINKDIPTPISTNQDFNAPTFNESSNFGVSQKPSYVNAGDHSSEFAYQPSVNVTDDIEGDSIFKTTQEVDKAMDSIMYDIKKSYSDKMAEPTKTLVDFVNKFVKWGNEVTANGLNRRLFDEYDEFLLFGVTGSGKTEIYIRLIEEALKLGKDSIMLVPEISLTPQTVDRFLSRFGEEKIAVLHSKLSVGERYDQWKKIERGDAKIVIGARSAIFAPVQNLGLIIIDEEHDDSYKSEMSPRYSAKEIASYLGKQHNVPVVLGSATPDMTTYRDAINGKKELLELTKRANNASLPDIEIVDLRHELASGNKTMVSQKLHDEIEENLKNKKQTILFLNRRGFATFIMCRDCGYTAKCKNCDITLTYHLKESKLKCHYCGYETKALTVCPECGGKNIRYFGTGTQ